MYQIIEKKMFYKVSTKRIKQRWNSATEAVCVFTKTWMCVRQKDEASAFSLKWDQRSDSINE